MVSSAQTLMCWSVNHATALSEKRREGRRRRGNSILRNNVKEKKDVNHAGKKDVYILKKSVGGFQTQTLCNVRKGSRSVLN